MHNVPDSPPGDGVRDDQPVWRFDNVIVDVARQQLWVDDTEVACQPQAFRLLVMLCEARGALVTRQELFDRLWPGGQEIGDTALTQLIWRLRGVLGASADAIKTVRRGGVRLDADVRIDPLRQPPAVPETPGAVPPPEPATSRPRARIGLWASAVAVLLFAAVATIALRRDDPLVSTDYELYASDLDAGRPDTVDLLTKSFAAERASDAGRAKQLMTQAAELDTRSPVAPALLAAYGFGDSGEARNWAVIAQSRLRDSTPPYARLLVQLAQVKDNDIAARQVEDAILDLRPKAWEVHLAVAHRYISQRELGLSLAAYRRVPFDALGPRVVVYVLSDRASFGDADVIEAELDSGRLALSPSADAYVRARLAYTRGRWAQAMSETDRAVALADTEGAHDNARKISEIGALAALISGSPEAANRFSAMLARCAGEYHLCATRMRSWLAILAARAGQDDVALRYIEEAWGSAKFAWEHAELHFIALKHGLPTHGTVDEVAASIPAEPSYAGLAELLHAWKAYAAGDRDDAVRRLARSRLEGIGRTYASEHALLLGARLGEPPVRCTVDPPFPNSLRVACCMELRDLADRSATTKEK